MLAEFGVTDISGAAIEAAHDNVLAVLALTQFEVLRDVVPLVAVNVVNGLGRQKRATNFSGHEEPVLAYVALMISHRSQWIIG